MIGRKWGGEEGLERRYFRILRIALLLYTRARHAKCVTEICGWNAILIRTGRLELNLKRDKRD